MMTTTYQTMQCAGREPAAWAEGEALWCAPRVSAEEAEARARRDREVVREVALEIALAPLAIAALPLVAALAALAGAARRWSRRQTAGAMPRSPQAERSPAIGTGAMPRTPEVCRG